MSEMVERVQAAWNSVPTLPPIEFSEDEAARLVEAIVNDEHEALWRRAIQAEARVSQLEREKADAFVEAFSQLPEIRKPA